VDNWSMQRMSCDELDLARPTIDGMHTVASSAIAQARARLGAEPCKPDERQYAKALWNTIPRGRWACSIGARAHTHVLTVGIQPSQRDPVLGT
jgi:hypothetical protein